jgi:DDE family transposase
MGSDDAVAAVLAGKFAEYRPHVDERAWRLYLGSEARAHAALSDCGLAAAAAVVAAAAGVSRATVMAGAGELAGGAEPAPGRSRRPGAGRPKAEDAQPGLAAALEGLLEEGKRGDPVSPLTWSTLSLRDIAREMALLGFGCSKDTAARLMRAGGWSLRGMSRVLEGAQHEDRDAQFRHVNARIAEYRASGDPVISVDAKKKENIGAYYRAGMSWRPAGDPVRVRDHDFADRDTGRVAPYGVYDVTANRGFVSVGTSHDTAAFAVNGIRLWRQEEGQFRYPHARRLLVTCDAGGSNGHRCRLWKDQLAVLAEETGLVIEVCHFPPGTSKWNKIEHRLFCHVTRTWEGRPLMTVEDAVAGIAATVTAQGLKCTAVTDPGDYPAGTEVSDERMSYLEDRVLDRDAFHGEWNYKVLPAPRQGPQPEPGPGRGPRRPGPDPALLGALAALAGVPAPAALHAAVAVTWHAGRERHKAIVRGGARRRAPNRNETYLKLSDEAVLVAAACRIRLGMTWALLAALLGVDLSTISVAAGNAVTVLEHHGITRHGRPRTATLASLRDQAAAAGISPTAFDNLPPQEKRPERGKPATATRPKPPTK